jgi:hypothetical protein
MALGGIGRDGASAPNGASPLDRFQQARDLARRKIEGDDTRNRLADLLQKKQAELGGVGGQPQGAARTAASAAAGAGPASAVRTASPARKMESPASAALEGGAGALGGLAAYGRGGATELPKAGPHLGRYIDLTA